MAFVPFTDCAEVVVSYRTLTNNTVMKNVFGVHSTTGPWSLASLTTLVEAVRDWWAADCKTWVSVELELVNVLARDLSVVDSYVVELGASVAGINNSPLLPASVTIAAKFTTGLAGRSFRGRWYWCGLTEGQVSGDYVAEATASTILAALRVLRETTLPSVDCELVILSRQHNGTLRTVGVATVVTAITWTDLRVDTQRRRLTGIGE